MWLFSEVINQLAPPSQVMLATHVSLNWTMHTVGNSFMMIDQCALVYTPTFMLAYVFMMVSVYFQIYISVFFKQIVFRWDVMVLLPTNLIKLSWLENKCIGYPITWLWLHTKYLFT